MEGKESGCRFFANKIRNVIPSHHLFLQHRAEILAYYDGDLRGGGVLYPLQQYGYCSSKYLRKQYESLRAQFRKLITLVVVIVSLYMKKGEKKKKQPDFFGLIYDVCLWNVRILVIRMYIPHLVLLL